MTWDDHELDNNYAAWIPEEGASFTGDDFIQRRKNAYQVYAETMPFRRGTASALGGARCRSFGS